MNTLVLHSESGKEVITPTEYPNEEDYLFTNNNFHNTYMTISKIVDNDLLSLVE